MRYITLLILGLALSGGASRLWASETFERKEQCDMPGPSLTKTKAEGREACEKLCSERADCKAALFITGWKKCLLKADTKTARLQFISGELDAQRTYTPGSFKLDNDHRGKDLERKVLGSADECGKACSENAGCGAFTYLEGYRVCWLKKPGGTFNPKVFTCSLRKG
jgi:PAN domain